MIIKAPQLDWNVIEAARSNAHTLRSQAAHEIGAAIANAVRRLFRVEEKPVAANMEPPLLPRRFTAPKVTSPLERGLQAGWY